MFCIDKDGYEWPLKFKPSIFSHILVCRPIDQPPSDVNKSLDGGTYPVLKMTRTSHQNFLGASTIRNRLSSWTSIATSCWWSLIETTTVVEFANWTLWIETTFKTVWVLLLTSAELLFLLLMTCKSNLILNIVIFFLLGCVELLNSVQKRIKPKYHIYGHIHEGLSSGPF